MLLHPINWNSHQLYHSEQSFDLGLVKIDSATLTILERLGYWHVLNTPFHQESRWVPGSKFTTVSIGSFCSKNNNKNLKGKRTVKQQFNFSICLQLMITFTKILWAFLIH